MRNYTPRPQPPLVNRWWETVCVAFAVSVLCGSCCCNLQSVHAESGGWPVPQGQASGGVTLTQPSAAPLAPRQAQPFQLTVINDTGATLVLDPCHEGYPYGEPRVVLHGESASWVWRPGETSVTDGVRIWGPKLKAVKKPGRRK